jgi:thiol-disulfide isomerase/thioredoxin
MTDQDITQKYVTLYYADWCGHCQTFKPEWFKFKAAYNKYKDEIKNKYKMELIINEYENDEYPEKATNDNVEGFPTIKIKYNDKTDDYIGDRTAIGLFKKTIQTPSDEEIALWLENIDNSSPLYGEVRLNSNNNDNSKNTKLGTSTTQMGGTNGLKKYGIYATDPKILFANSYRKYLKYKRKCENLGLI